MPACLPRLRLALLAPLLAVGCGDGAAPPAPDGRADGLGGGAVPDAAPPGLSADRAAYAPGDSLTLRLAPTAEVMYNLCGAVLERRESGRWTRYVGETRFATPEDRERGVDFVCQDIGYTVGAGESARYVLRLSDRLEPGTYRFQDIVQRDPFGDATTWDTLATAPFEIR